jgi:NAD-dependent dihydropyrimidine dehydrogenase PreA subunit
VALAVRKIVSIDEEKCDGCGACIPGCVEGALKVIDGKARLVSDRYCDGLGACLGKCPQDAITVEERSAEQFDEAAAMAHQSEAAPAPGTSCPGSRLIHLGTVRPASAPTSPQVDAQEPSGSALTHWPVQLALVPPRASFLAGADIALIADCVPFAYPEVHRDFIQNHAVLIACPKLDDFPAHLERLTAILRQSRPRSLSVVHMEVPCCFGLAQMAHQAVRASGASALLSDITISTSGEVLSAR